MTGQMENVADVYKDPRFNPEIDRRTGYRTKSVLAAPMFNAKDHVIGVFQVLNRKNGKSFDQLDEEVLALLADQASGHVENAQLYQEVRKATQETIIRLAAAVEFKDHDTRAHLWRMSQYSAIVAREMGFDPEWAENLRLAAPMHDIGKIGVPDAILNKPGKLTPEEWVEMKKHPQHGAEILKDSENELMQMSATVALCHHEKWDGSGYPRGLKGDEIPIEARIATIADVFDALTSKRIYKPQFSLEETLSIIRADSGKHFDPQVVDAFLRALPKITPIMEMFAPKDGQTEPAQLPSW
jgi:HD-GYP domain-containing protein (c-di-GMP phosphodiesterase class II)